MTQATSVTTIVTGDVTTGVAVSKGTEQAATMMAAIAAAGPGPMAGIVPEIHLAEQARLLTEIIHMMVGIDVEPSSSVWPPPGEDLVEAVVRFSGPWAGAMIFESTLPLSFEFTARFMTVPLPATIDDDVRDAHGELANMIAGNFKALLPAGSRLSIPQVRLHRPAGKRSGAALAKDPVRAASLSQSVFYTPYGGCCLVLESTTAGVTGEGTCADARQP